MEKWDYKTHTYKPYKVPKDWNCKTYTDYLDEFINCAQCGKKRKFGDMYTSKEIHTYLGLGYAVCEKCHTKEWERYQIRGGEDL